jgi:hypothetical protein
VRFSGAARNPSDTPPKWPGNPARKRPPGRVGDEARASAVIRATDIILTHGGYRIGPGWACRAKPERGAASEMSPNPALLLRPLNPREREPVARRAPPPERRSTKGRSIRTAPRTRF